MPKQTLLLYDPHGAPWVPKLRQMCAIQGLRLRTVEDADLGRPVAALAEGLRPAGEVQPFPPIPEPVLVFCSVGSQQLDRLLQALRNMEVPRTCLKAVLTQSNAQWPFYTLYEELSREREAMPG